MSETIYSAGLFNNPNVTKRAKEFVLGVMLGGIPASEYRESSNKSDVNTPKTHYLTFFDRARKPYMIAFEPGVASSLTNSVVPGIAKQPRLFSENFVNEMDRILSGEYNDETVAEMVLSERAIMYKGNNTMNRENWNGLGGNVKGIEALLAEAGQIFESSGEIGEHGLTASFIGKVSPIFTTEKKNSITSQAQTAQA